MILSTEKKPRVPPKSVWYDSGTVSSSLLEVNITQPRLYKCTAFTGPWFWRCGFVAGSWLFLACPCGGYRAKGSYSISVASLITWRTCNRDLLFFWLLESLWYVFCYKKHEFDTKFYIDIYICTIYPLFCLSMHLDKYIQKHGFILILGYWLVIINLPQMLRYWMSKYETRSPHKIQWDMQFCGVVLISSIVWFSLPGTAGNLV